MGRFLIIDADNSLVTRLSDHFGSQGHLIVAEPNLADAMKSVERHNYDVVIADTATVGEGMDDLLNLLGGLNRQAVIVVMADHDGLRTATRFLRESTTDLIQKPIDMIELDFRVGKCLDLARLSYESQALRGERDLIYRTAGIVGQSPAIRRVLDLTEKVANSATSVVLQGETGTGKEIIAGAIHYNSPRAARAFVRVNCATLPDTLLESELFGHEKGAFTGADKLRIGRFEQANLGTIFLDEIADVALHTQAKLLRVLQEQEFERIGSNRTIKVDVRVVSATNKNLVEEVEAGRFRADLYFRLHVVSITIPPLRDRDGDVELLANHFLRKFGTELKKKVTRFDEAAIRRLRDYQWPGNVRELKNTIERAVIMAESDVITPPDLNLPTRAPSASGDLSQIRVPPNGLRWEEMERKLVVEALEMSAWVQKDAAHLLGLSTRVLNYKVKSFGITHPSWRQNR